MPVTRIILDTDLSMGYGADVDDGFALALAHADPAIQMDLITTVNGNTDIESATILTGVLLNRFGIQDTPLVRGSATPIIHTDQSRPSRSRTQRHGASSDPRLRPCGHCRANPGQSGRNHHCRHWTSYQRRHHPSSRASNKDSHQGACHHGGSLLRDHVFTRQAGRVQRLLRP